MIKATIKEKLFEIESANDGLSGTINNKDYALNLIALNEHKYHLIYNNQSINLNIIELSSDRKQATLQINGNILEVSLEDEFDLLLKNLGMSSNTNKKLNEIKAPMPGLVLRINARVGETIKKGEPLLVLEAMKMENMIKAPEDVTVSKIHVNQAQAIEKGQLLMSFV